MSVPLISQHLPIKRERPIRAELDVEMPNSESAEMAILGSILTFNAAYYRVADISTDDFFWERNKVIYAAMALMVAEGQDIEILTLKEQLAKQGRLEAAGGVVYLSGLLDYYNPAQIEQYSAIVKRASKKRALIIAGNALMRHALESENEPEESAAIALAAIGSGASTSDESQARPLVEVLADAYESMRALQERGVSISLTSDWPTFDSHKVFSPTFIVFGAHSSVGKSGLMVQLAEDIARNDQPVALVSLESTPRELALRYTSMMTGVAHSLMRDWRILGDGNMAKVNDCQRAAAKRSIYIGRGPRCAEEIVLELRRLKAVHGIRLAQVDYIQLVDLKRRVDNREERLAEVAKIFLETAVDLDITILAYSQLRDGAGKEGRFVLEDLAYARAIGKSARSVLIFDRPGRIPGTQDAQGRIIPSCRLDMYLVKNSEERTGDFQAHFLEAQQRFEEGVWRCEDGRHVRPYVAEAQEAKLFR